MGSTRKRDGGGWQHNSNGERVPPPSAQKAGSKTSERRGSREDEDGDRSGEDDAGEMTGMAGEDNSGETMGGDAG